MKSLVVTLFVVAVGLLAGCGTSDPGPAPQLDTSHCSSAGMLGGHSPISDLCRSQAEEQWRHRRDAWEAKRQRASATGGGSRSHSQPWGFAVAGAMLLGGIALARRGFFAVHGVAPGRDRKGPARQIALSAAAARISLGGPAALIGGLGMAAAVPGWPGATALIACGGAGTVAAALAVPARRKAQKGWRLAEQRWADDVRAAELAGQAPPPEPHLDGPAARALADTKGFTAPAGSAATVLLDAAGKPGPASAAFDRVMVALGFTYPPDEAGGDRLPWAAVIGATADDDGDVDLWVKILHSGKSAASLTAVVAPFLREARVRAIRGGVFLTDVSTGLVHATFTMDEPAAAAPAAAPPASPEWDF